MERGKNRAFGSLGVSGCQNALQMVPKPPQAGPTTPPKDRMTKEPDKGSATGECEDDLTTEAPDDDSSRGCLSDSDFCRIHT